MIGVLGIVLGVIGAIGVVYSIVAYYQQRKPKPKRLDYRILNRIQIVSRHARGLPQALETPAYFESHREDSPTCQQLNSKPRTRLTPLRIAPSTS
jgi:hypothetical protein